MAASEFDRVSPWLQKALEEDGGAFSLDDIRAAVESRRAKLLTAPHAAVLLEVIQYPRFSALRVVGAGGETGEALEEVRQFAKAVPEIAKALGLHRYEWRGRPGWARVLKELGMTTQVFMFKEVSPNA